MNGDAQRRARKGLAIYLGVVVALSALIEGTIISHGGPISDHGLLVVALMWTPTLAMIVARLALWEGIGDVSFRLGVRRGGWREYLVAWLYPVVVGAVAYGLAWGTGLAAFGGDGGVAGFFANLGLSLTLITLLSAVTATGEELGWRGYMLTKLIDAGVPRPALVSGVIWALWHSPLILSGQYAAGPSPVLSTAVFFVGMIAATYVFVRIRLASGSVWPAVLFHATWNAVIQGGFDAYVPGHTSAQAGNVWVGEAGLLVVAAHLGLALLLVWRPFPVRHHPRQETPTTGSIRSL